MSAREAAEQKQREYEERMIRMKEEMERAQRELEHAQEIIRRLEQQLAELHQVCPLGRGAQLLPTPFFRPSKNWN